MRKVTSLIILLTIFTASSLFAQTNALFSTLSKKDRINVGILVYDEVEALDLNGPLDVFVKANSENKYHIYLVSANNKKQISTQSGGSTILTQYNIQDAPQTDILIIPGAFPNVVQDLSKNNPGLISWIINQNKLNSITMSVCTGGLLLANTGLLDNHKATTHQWAISELKKHNKVNVQENVRFQIDGKFITAAGVTSGIDGSLEVIELIDGKEMADNIAQALVYDRRNNLDFINK